jgi:hypothetical protein
LLKARQITLELDLFYAKSEQGNVLFGNLEQNTFTSNYSVRYGLWDDLQLSSSLPLNYQTTKLDQFNQISSNSNTHLGSLSFALRQAVLKEGLGYPNAIVSLESQIPTEYGDYGLGGGLALTKNIDPAVLFGNFNYLHAFAGETANLIGPQSKHTFSAVLGIAYALNDTLMLSTSVSGVFAPRTAFANAALAAKERYSLQLGLTSLLTERLYVEPTVSFGLNGASSDVAFGISLPYTF